MMQIQKSESEPTPSIQHRPGCEHAAESVRSLNEAIDLLRSVRDQIVHAHESENHAKAVSVMSDCLSRLENAQIPVAASISKAHTFAEKFKDARSEIVRLQGEGSP